MSKAVPAVMITAPASGQGKSMVTAALARLHRNAGREVRVFKHGPDYLDPMVLEVASGNPVYQLHPWMTGEDECRWRLAEAAKTADLILIEGAMGLFDGDPSSADLAKLMGIPALPVIDAGGMAQTFGAVASGLARFDPELAVYQVIANKIGSPRHGDMLREGLPKGISLLGAIPRNDAMNIPDRHMGLVQPAELSTLDQQLDSAAEVLKAAGLNELPKAVPVAAVEPVRPQALLTGVRIAIARDIAFSFIYRANTELLLAMGAELHYFSPLTDSELPTADALWLPGGYPDLHGNTLGNNLPMREAIKAFYDAGKPILAECGGLIGCMEEFSDKAGAVHALFGLLPGQAAIAKRLQGIGMHSLNTKEGELRGHTFHRFTLNTSWQPVAYTRKQAGTGSEAVFSSKGLVASLFYSYFPSAPEVVAAIFKGQPLTYLDDKETTHA
ncbi:cobyrinate a,c-diamide synthase [Marinobacter salexigens]|uniref:cobyrinate a,c-diamide synthase n=1 Tax=Marinobacter salexigens TaxID=1925763 RepID=UPI000C2931FB|nr:cobyrinate a,c-diamide synthase [Marinobacter salexigens]